MKYEKIDIIRIQNTIIKDLNSENMFNDKRKNFITQLLLKSNKLAHFFIIYKLLK